VPEANGENMTTDIKQHFPLTSAYLCPDCNSIGNNSMHCPACASDVLMALEGVLNRKITKKSKNRIPAVISGWRPQIQLAA
jgi:hypothetical protein